MKYLAENYYFIHYRFRAKKTQIMQNPVQNPGKEPFTLFAKHSISDIY